MQSNRNFGWSLGQKRRKKNPKTDRQRAVYCKFNTYQTNLIKYANDNVKVIGDRIKWAKNSSTRGDQKETQIVLHFPAQKNHGSRFMFPLAKRSQQKDNHTLFSVNSKSQFNQILFCTCELWPKKRRKSLTSINTKWHYQQQQHNHIHSFTYSI